MSFSLRQISIRFQFMFWIFVSVLTAVVATGWVIHARVRTNLEKEAAESLSRSSDGALRMVKASLTLSIRSHLSGIAQKNAATLAKLNQDVITGKMTHKAAWEMAKGILLSQTIGQTGYIYAISSQGVIRIHPHPEMQGRDMSHHWLAKTQAAQKEGFIEYDWKNPGEAVERKKVLYMTYFEPWDLILSVTSYKEEFISLFDLEVLKSDLLSFGSARAGRIFILDKAGDLLVQSDLAPMGSGSRPGQIWQEMLGEIQQLKEGHISRQVLDTGIGKTREILVFFRYVPDLNWYVGSFVYLDEIHAHLDEVRQLVAVTAILVLALLLPGSLFLGRLLTRPLTRLTQDLEASDQARFDVRADEAALGEVGDLARHFNAYLAQLKKAHENLGQETKRRTLAEGQLTMFAEVFKNALEGITITDDTGRILAVNPAFTDITGYKEGEVLGQNPRILKSDRHDLAFYEAMWESLVNQGQWAGEIWNRRKSGEAYPVILSIFAIKNANQETTHYVAVFHDITEMKSKQEAIRYQAFHDALTGLPNRYLAQDRLETALRHARRSQERVVVFFLDMDNFKYINDSLGHAAGDILLQLFGNRLKTLVREQDTVARLGGDEFLVIALNLGSDQEIIELAERLIQGMQSPFPLEDHDHVATFSLGITSFPADGQDAQTLIKNADTAMYQAKEKGKNQFAVFTPELSRVVDLRMQMERQFRKALDQGDFKVLYQPKIDPSTGRVAGVEALVRWEKEDGTLVSPADFIPFAEETGLILPLGRRVMEIACSQVVALNRHLTRPVALAVNLSPRQFGQATLLDEVMAILGTAGLAPALLELEITETTLMTDLSTRQLSSFKDQGIAIAIDDFGTGYSSLYYLKIFPITTLKIDRSFIKDIMVNAVDAKIVETIVLMAGNLGLDVVAEGVETADQLEMVRAFGCRFIQGHYYTKPLPYDQILSFCLERNEKL